MYSVVRRVELRHFKPGLTEKEFARINWYDLAPEEGPVPYDSTVAPAEQPRHLKMVAALPHSCDDWVIGGPEEIEMMIHDLQDILERFKAAPWLIDLTRKGDPCLEGKEKP